MNMRVSWLNSFAGPQKRMIAAKPAVANHVRAMGYLIFSLKHFEVTSDSKSAYLHGEELPKRRAGEHSETIDSH